MYLLELLVQEREKKVECEKISRSKARRQRKKEIKMLEKESCASSEAQTAETKSIDDPNESAREECSGAAAAEQDPGESSSGGNDTAEADQGVQSQEELSLLAAMGWQCTLEGEDEDEDEECFDEELEALKAMQSQNQTADQRAELRARLKADFQSRLTNWPAASGASTSSS